MSFINSAPRFTIERTEHRKYGGAPTHFHNYHELYFCVQGEAKYFIDDQIYELSSGEMIFIPQNVFHQTDYDHTKSSMIERVLFSFTSDFVGEDFELFLHDIGLKKQIIFDSHGLHRINDTICKIERENNLKRPNYELMQRLLFQQLLIQISRYQKLNISPLTPTLLLMQNIAKYISDNSSSDISLKSLSREFSISPSYLSKCFKQSTGVGIKEYINIARVQEAKKLLETTDLPILDVAGKCGFNDGNYFAAVFKRIVGITPKKYQFINNHRS